MKNKKSFISEIIPYVIIIIIVILVKTYLFTTVLVNGASMENTLHDKDLMILNKIGVKTKGLNRFDIIVINTDNSKIIKRVIALPGETIEYKNNKLYINGKFMRDKYGNGITSDIAEIKLGKDEYFVLGDNRENSIDSRIIGPVNITEILGHADFIIYPFSRFGSR